jgi:large subunit ribosomal protein L25
METRVLAAEPREIVKKGAEKLRRNGQVPAVIYHKGEETIAISVNEIALNKIVHSSESHLIELTFPDGKTKRSFIKQVQFHPVSDRVIHTDFQLFSVDEVVEMEVPIHIEGECPGVKFGGGKVQVNLHTLTVKGKPEDVPEHISVDLSELEIGQTLHLGEVKLGSLEGKIQVIGEKDAPVVSILAPRKEAETTTEETPAEA